MNLEKCSKRMKRQRMVFSGDAGKRCVEERVRFAFVGGWFAYQKKGAFAMQAKRLLWELCWGAISVSLENEKKNDKPHLLASAQQRRTSHFARPHTKQPKTPKKKKLFFSPAPFGPACTRTVLLSASMFPPDEAAVLFCGSLLAPSGLITIVMGPLASFHFQRPFGANETPA